MDIGVIGAGPAGSVAATALAQRGHRVSVFERESFPRFRIGESLLPANMPVFGAIGIGESFFEDLGAPRKHAAFFEHSDGDTRRFDFGDGLAGDHPHAYQVTRAAFDSALLDHARAQGVIVHQPCRIRNIDTASERAIISDQDGHRHHVDFVIDASGRSTLIARQRRAIDHLGDLERAAVYGHIDGLTMPESAIYGDIVISMGGDGWAWQIPLGPDHCSVGLVLDRASVKATGGDPRAIFTHHLDRFPALARRLDGRVPALVRATPDISFNVGQRFGPNWAVIGDAGGFIDPIFSSGVLLATRSALRLADTLDAEGKSADLTAWDRGRSHDLAVFEAFIRLWYNRRTIQGLFFGQSREESIYRGIVSLLAGYTDRPDNVFLQMLEKRVATAG